ncbi:RTA1 like protein-domain-containing protein [Mycena floridula]|nr:RTA1 like protein-domain-containing protein [Mycena floridula]
MSPPLSLVLFAFGYVPNKTPAIVWGVLGVATGAVLLFNAIRAKSWWGLCLPISAIGYGLGFFVRIQLISHQNSKPLFVVSQILIDCMPAGFLAFNYITYGRLLRTYPWASPLHDTVRCFCPTIVSTLFILSDILTFLIQVGGAALLSNVDRRQLGMLAASFILYLCMLAWTHFHVKREGVASKKAAWWKIFYTLYFSSALIVFRAIYRIIASVSNREAAVNTNEVFLYVLDGVPLLLAISVYIPFWPAKYLLQDSILEPQSYKMNNV